MVPALNKVTHPVVIGVAIFLLVGLVGGNILAFTNPEHALAAPFRDVAFTLTKTASDTGCLIEDIRAVAASSERKVVSTALQSMRVDKGLNPEVTTLTNDMANFPSQRYSLFPDYLENRLASTNTPLTAKGLCSLKLLGQRLTNLSRILSR
jgi:hypothetical protein